MFKAALLLAVMGVTLTGCVVTPYDHDPRVTPRYGYSTGYATQTPYPPYYQPSLSGQRPPSVKPPPQSQRPPNAKPPAQGQRPPNAKPPTQGQRPPNNKPPQTNKPIPPSSGWGRPSLL
jgi:hypothetical protein